MCVSMHVCSVGRECVRRDMCVACYVCGDGSRDTRRHESVVSMAGVCPDWGQAVWCHSSSVYVGSQQVVHAAV